MHPLDLPLERLAEWLRAGEVSAVELGEEAIRRHQERDELLHAYKHFDADAVRVSARWSDHVLRERPIPPPLCGIPISVKDLYGVEGMPTFAGTRRRLPEAWEHDGWLVARLREQCSIFTGKTHTVELAYGGVGINPHWGTPVNPWDAERHRVPGGSSAGAGVSLWEGSAVVALGTDTGGSIRIPASLTGSVGHKTTWGRWGVDGVVPLSSTLDSVGGLTRTVADSAYFFGSVDPEWGDPRAFLEELGSLTRRRVRVGLPSCSIWTDCQSDLAERLGGALEELTAAGWSRQELEGGHVLDQAVELYRTGGIAGTELRAFLETDLPEWVDILHPTVGQRIEPWPRHLKGREYRGALSRRRRLMRAAEALFTDVDVLALPGAIITPPAVDELDDLDRYVEVNWQLLRPTCTVSMLGLCAVTIPVARDAAGMPVGLQLVARGGRDETALAAAIAAERILGTAAERLGQPPVLQGLRSAS